jgi:hypothetical protein
MILDPRTVDGYGARVSTLRSLDGSKIVRFYAFSLPEDRCLCLLVKTLGRQMPEEVVQKKLGILWICVQGVVQHRSGRRDQEASNARPLTLNFIFLVARELEVEICVLTEICGL